MLCLSRYLTIPNSWRLRLIYLESWWQSSTISMFTLAAHPSSQSCSKYCFRWSKCSGRIFWLGWCVLCFCCLLFVEEKVFAAAGREGKPPQLLLHQNDIFSSKSGPAGWVLSCCCLDVLGISEGHASDLSFLFHGEKDFHSYRRKNSRKQDS